MPRGVVVAHTPVPIPHPEFRSQNVGRLSMVYTVYTLSMGTYWVLRSLSESRSSLGLASPH